MPKPKAHQRSESFGRRLARLRRAAGLTQQQLADQTGISRRMIAHYETQDGTAVATGEALTKLAQALSISTDELLGLRPPALQPEEAPRSTTELRLWRKLRQLQKLPPRKQQAVLDVLEDFLAANVKDECD